MTGGTASTADQGGLERSAGELAARLGPGDRLFLSGELGTGKTTFIRAVLRSLGVEGAIPSPSFSVVSSYSCQSFAFHHVDLYRLEGSASELEQFGILDLLASGDVVAVEWAERLPAELRSGGYGVLIRLLPGGDRELTIEDRRMAGDRDQ
jgi:tRNA threonylcarbamoyladenosine biosynthesis protein TsaE